jgi:imidazolonepropionase-like amidohydrolase
MATSRFEPDLTRRAFLGLSAASAAFVVGCGDSVDRRSPLASGSPSQTPPAGPTEPPPGPSIQSPAPSVTAPSAGPERPRRTLYRDGALADGRDDQPRVGVSILVEGGRITWIRDAGDEGELDPDVETIDSSGSTFVPGMVDCHSHVTLPGGAHWIERVGDSPTALVAAAEQNGRLLTRAGVRWARDVGSPRGQDPVDGRERALALGFRDRWLGRPEYPIIRAAGTWLFRTGTQPAGIAVEARDADELLAAALAQLDEGADLVKLYLDGPDPATSPWSISELRRVVEAVHGRDGKVTAHSGRLDGARVGAAAGVDALEHGFELDADVARTMVANKIALVSTLTVFRSWATFARTTTLPAFTNADRRRALGERREAAIASVQAARRAGVAIAAGTDFGGGSARANQLAWEVEALVEAGMEPWEALGAATWRGGELLGEPDAGVIRERGPADFSLVHGDPTSDPTAMWRVWRVAWAD